jgi:acetyltransferase-like isoleucine patch superfamily enzyme
MVHKFKKYLPKGIVHKLADCRMAWCYPNVARGTNTYIGRHCVFDSLSEIGNYSSVGSRCLFSETKIGRFCSIAGESIFRGCDIDDLSYLGPRSAVTRATVGKFCSIAPEVYIGLGRHTLAPFVSTHPAFVLANRANVECFGDKDYFEEFAQTQIGNDVWLGLRVAIRDGVRIGDGAIVAAGAVVNTDVPPYAIAGGVPARVIRYRFSREIIEFLLEFKWWNKSEDWLRANWRKFHDIHTFLNEYKAHEDVLEATGPDESVGGVRALPSSLASWPVLAENK